MSRKHGLNNIATGHEQEAAVQILPHPAAHTSEPEALRVSLDLLSEPALIHGLDGAIYKANDAAARTLEADGDELLDRNIFSLLLPKPTEETIARLARGETARFELDCLTLKGKQIRVEILDVPLRSATGEVDRVLSFGRDVSKQRRAEREQALLAAIVESSDDAIVSLSLDLTIVTWNRGAEKLFGFTAAEAIGQPTTIYIPPGLRDHGLKLLKELQTRLDHPQTFEVPCLRKDGTCVDVWTVCFGIRDSSGGLVGMSAIHRDLTERKRAERERTQLAAIVESSDDAIIRVSPDLRISYWNRGAEKMFGFTAAEAIGQPFTLHIPPERHAHAWEITNQLMAHPEQVVRFEGPNCRKDGTRVEVSTVLFALRDPEGKIIAISAMQRDITRSKQAERANAELAGIVNYSRDAIISVSSELKIVSWNRAAEKAYGFSEKEALGKGLDLFVPPEELAQTHATTRHVIETGQPASWEQHALRRDGTRFISAVNIFPMRDAVGNLTGVAGIGRDITHLKEIERDLREARDYTRGLIESSVDAMVVVDRDLRISDGNEQLARLIEVPKRVLISSRFDGYFAEPARATAAIERALADGSVTNHDLVLRTASGRQVLVSFSASVFSRAGAVSGIFGVARDVTDQRTIQRKLAEERQYSRSLVESSPDALLVINSEMVLTDVNAQTARLTGYSREQLVGIKLASVFTDPERAIEIVHQALDAGFVQEAELCLLTRTADEIPVSLNASIFRDADGSTRGVILGVRDISERKLAEEERSLLASIVDASGDAIYSESPDLTITSWNAAAERLFGFKADEIVHRNAALLVPLDRRSEMLQQLDASTITGQAEHFETVRQRKDGSRINVALTRAPIFDSTRNVLGFSVTAHDISNRIRTEAELIAARDAALEAARVKSEFLANMSHEIRTPLNSVIGMTGLLLDTRLSPEQREFAHDVRESGEALLSLINEILDFSKLAAGKMAFEEIDFDLTAAVEGAVELVAEQARRKDLELTVAIDDDAPQNLRGDPGRLRQVLLNLIGNAIKFTTAGEVALQIGKLSENLAETILRFEVRDTGIGIPQDKAHLLFQPFSQLDASTTRQFGGTGLGLSIARQLVERMGGTISVASKPGSGSTFWFTAKFAKQVSVTKAASERFASFAGVKMLIVDDNTNSLHILSDRACAWKMEVATAGSAQLALALMRAAAREHPFEVVLSDVQMPEVDGIELARMIKSDPALAATAVILVSSVGSESEYRARLQGIELDGWLIKPVPQSSLYNALVEAFARRNRDARDPQTPDPRTISLRTAHDPSLKLRVDRKLRVLLAEDNPINQKLAKFQLKKLGADIDCVANGREAVEAAMRIPYDAILMDCQMPEMDGYEATKEIRRLEGSQDHTPIIALTAHPLAGDREICLAAGMDAYISKPVKPDILERILAEVTAADAAPAPVVDTATLPTPTAGSESPSSPPAQPLPANPAKAA